METRTFAIPGPVLITPRKFEDARGYFSEVYNQGIFDPLIGSARFVQDNQSLSRPVGTIRGLHFQAPPHAQGKLVRVLRGSVYDVAVDLRRSSPSYGRHVGVVLSAENRAQLWIPTGFAHGFCTLEADTEVFYKVTDVYSPADDRGLAFDDPALGIDWPVAAEAAVLSDKDRTFPRLADLPACFE